MLGHILLAVSFLRKKPISRASLVQWAILSVLAADLAGLWFVPEMGPAGWGAVICVPILLLLVYSAGGRGLRTGYAAGFLLASDLLLGAYLFVWNNPPVHILYTALLSISLMLLSLGEKAAGTEKGS